MSDSSGQSAGALSLRGGQRLAALETLHRQLAIAEDVQGRVERQAWARVLCVIDPEDAFAFLACKATLTPDQIKRWQDCWSWWWLSKNTALPWSIELIEHFQDRWEWDSLKWNAAISFPPFPPAELDRLLVSLAQRLAQKQTDSDFDLDF